MLLLDLASSSSAKRALEIDFDACAK